MSDNPFLDKSEAPDDTRLAEALGRSHRHWQALKAHLAEAFPPLTETWKFPAKTIGWTLQVRQKKRTIFWLSPRRKHFLASTAFGEKAVAAARKSDLPKDVIEGLEGARKYAEGRPVRIEVRTKADLAVTKTVAAIKMAT